MSDPGGPELESNPPDISKALEDSVGVLTAPNAVVASPTTSVKWDKEGTPLKRNNNPDSFLIAKAKALNRRVLLNVGGTKHEVSFYMLIVNFFYSYFMGTVQILARQHFLY